MCAATAKPATENQRRSDSTGRSGRSRRLRRRSGKMTAAVAATALACGAAFSMLSSGVASAAAKPAWLMTAGNIQSLSKQDPATAAHFFNTPSSYGAGASLVRTPVQAGYATTPVLNYTSYAQFSSDIASGAIKYGYEWVMYDPEKWAQTPLAEQQSPNWYMKQFGQLAHANGLQVIHAPGLSLAYVTDTHQSPRQPGETCSHWFTRVGTPGTAATYGDIFLLQNESNMDNLTEYMSLYKTAAAQARGANSQVKVYSEVSTANGTPDQMTAAALSVSPDGFYVAAPDAIPQAGQFFQNMRAAGY
jgi:hypothetical protein